jgi:hypothetical protein
MKQILFLICFLQLFAICFSQNTLETGMTIGYNSSIFIGHDKPGKLEPMPGFYLGGIIKVPINKWVSLLSNVSLSSKGTEFTAISNLKEMVLFLYLDVPIMVKLNIFADKKLSPYALFGGTFDYNILAVGSGGPLYDIKKVDLGVVTGIGLDMGKISIGMRYNYGITKFDNSDLKTDLKNSTLSILIGISFNK